MSNIQISNGTFVINNRVVVNGEELPPVPTKSRSHSYTQIDDKVYIDGYEYKDGKWKKTLAALWHKWF